MIKVSKLLGNSNCKLNDTDCKKADCVEMGIVPWGRRQLVSCTVRCQSKRRRSKQFLPPLMLASMNGHLTGKFDENDLETRCSGTNMAGPR